MPLSVTQSPIDLISKTHVYVSTDKEPALKKINK
jgi:hypothetical protein